MLLNYALKVDSITCFRQQLFYLTELNSTPLSCYSCGTVQQALAAIFVSSQDAPPPLLGKSCCVTRQNTAARETSSARK